MTLRTLIEEAKKLPKDEQAELLDELICMVGAEPADVVLTPVQKLDLERRLEEYKAGKAGMVPGDEAFEKLRRRI